VRIEMAHYEAAQEEYQVGETDPQRIAPLKSITVEWYEGFQFIQYPFTLYVWSALQKFLEYLWEEESSDTYAGYTKVKVRIEWKNGDVLEDRIDVGSGVGDFNPQFISIGTYLKGPGVGSPPRGVMYGSSFQYDMNEKGIVTETTRDNVSWTDIARD